MVSNPPKRADTLVEDLDFQAIRIDLAYASRGFNLEGLFLGAFEYSNKVMAAKLAFNELETMDVVGSC